MYMILVKYSLTFDMFIYQLDRALWFSDVSRLESHSKKYIEDLTTAVWLCVYAQSVSSL